MRLIDADKLPRHGGRGGIVHWTDIEKAPTVDAVPVIRCYECKHFREFEKGFSNDWDGSCKYWNTHSTVYSNFCGCAERKEE